MPKFLMLYTTAGRRGLLVVPNQSPVFPRLFYDPSPCFKHLLRERVPDPGLRLGFGVDLVDGLKNRNLKV